jgi:RNA 2',3'-cyclic 3'-phosphodiesterase
VARNSPSEAGGERRSSGRPGSPRARLFLALEPCTEDREALAAWRDELVAGRDDLRPMAAESLHLTLAFLGYRPEKEIARIARAAFAAVRELEPAVLVPDAVVPVPRRGPRLFALDLDDEGGRAAQIQSAASEALVRERFYRPERREWWPHLTLARVKRGRRAAPLEPSQTAPGPLRAPFVTLYRSLLRPQGALYVPLERIELRGAPHGIQ